MKIISKTLMLVIMGMFFATSVFAQLGNDSGLDEKLGEQIPLNLYFLNEQGDSVQLKDIITRPTILSLVYFRCPGICSPLLGGIVEAVEQLNEKPGKDYKILTISFDPTDTPALAQKKKENYIKSFTVPFPPEQWQFLTGDSASIRAITKAVGFRYKKQGKDFVHPGLVTILSPHGKIARYLYGISFLPFDLKMALLEASQERTGPTISRVLLYCFSYDPAGKKYAFNFLKVTGSIILFLVLVFAVFLFFTGRARRKKVRTTNVG